MEKIRFINTSTIYDGEVSIYGKILSIQFTTPPSANVLTNGIELLNEHNGIVQGDYADYTTLYRTFDDNELLYEFSNDGSTYTPPEPAPAPEPEEPYVPTLDEVKAIKKQEIHSTYQTVKASGINVMLSFGEEHFPLSDEDIVFLMGKQFELLSGTAEQLSYQDSENHCKFYSRDDMQKIIETALFFVNYQTTYRNSLCEWIDACTTTEEVSAIFYGADIPEEHQNDVYKTYLSRMTEATTD